MSSNNSDIGCNSISYFIRLFYPIDLESYWKVTKLEPGSQSYFRGFTAQPG